MRIACIALIVTVMLLSGQAPQEQPPSRPQLPPGHPPMQPQLPSGHPPVSGGARARPTTGPVATVPADVATVDALVRTYYDSISGAAGQERQWDRFRSLFLPGARMITARPMGDVAVPMALTPEDYVRANDTYFKGGGYFEREAHRRSDEYGKIAQVFSTYESRRNEDAPSPYSRGINCFQLLHDGQRWWIVSVIWDYERPDDNPLPAEYLPAE